MTVVGLIFKTHAVARMPLPLRRMSMLGSVILGKRPSLNLSPLVGDQSSQNTDQLYLFNNSWCG